MATLTTDQVKFIRDFIGDSEPPDDFELQEMYDRIGTTIGVAHAVLQKRLGEYLATAASYSIVGVYQESTQANIDNLRQQVKDMEETYPEIIDVAAGNTVGLGVSRLVRYGRAR